MTKTVVFLLVSILLPPGLVSAHADMESKLLEVVKTACDALSKSPFHRPPAILDVRPNRSDIVFRGQVIGDRYNYNKPGEFSLRLDFVSPRNQAPRVISELRNADDLPVFYLGTNAQCEVAHRRRLHYSPAGPDKLEILDSKLNVDRVEQLNPPLPEKLTAQTRQSVRVAMIDSGVNYTLPRIIDGLGRAGDGRVLGFDFWDMDSQPFDANPRGSPFFIQRHGTQTASLAMAENPNLEVVAYRYPRSDMTRLRRLLQHARGLGIRIVGMPLGSNKPEDWRAFEFAAEEFDDMLFVVSAGNAARDLDRTPSYPASLTLDNMIVVTSSDDFAKLAQGSNWGLRSVDFLVPAERQRAIGFEGNEARVSGSSYAVSRVVAMAANMLAIQPGIETQKLIEEIERRALPATAEQGVRLGYLPDPRAGMATIEWRATDVPHRFEHLIESEDGLSLDVLILDSRWTKSEIYGAIDFAGRILQQCEIRLQKPRVFQFDGTDYLRYLDTGASHTLLSNAPESAGGQRIKLIFATDTRMEVEFEAEAFGAGNTRTRPWMENSLWVMLGAPDLGITIAHELMHILMNSGRHSMDATNLMSAQTKLGATHLSPDQCRRAQRFAY